MKKYEDVQKKTRCLVCGGSPPNSCLCTGRRQNGPKRLECASNGFENSCDLKTCNKQSLTTKMKKKCRPIFTYLSNCGSLSILSTAASAGRWASSSCSVGATSGKGQSCLIYRCKSFSPPFAWKAISKPKLSIFLYRHWQK